MSDPEIMAAFSNPKVAQAMQEPCPNHRRSNMYIYIYIHIYIYIFIIIYILYILYIMPCPNHIISLASAI